MSKILKKMDYQIDSAEANTFLLDKPQEKQSIVIEVEIKDKENIFHSTNYSFIDEVTGKKGRKLIWNNYNNAFEIIKIAILNQKSYQIQLPKNLELIAFYC